MTDTAVSLLDQLHAHRDLMMRVARSLEAISYTLEEVNMTRMAGKIQGLVETVFESTEALNAAYSADLDTRWREAQNHLGVTLVTLLNRKEA